MRILAVVPARGGSKRLPRKNTRLLGGKPLIAWSIDVVRGLPGICDVLVSTDDETIAQVAGSAGGLVPWLRPDHLATDTASSVDVCMHALQWYEREKGGIEGLLLLQPTSPFRSRDTVTRGIDLFVSHSGRPVLAVSPADPHPDWCLKLVGGLLHPYSGTCALLCRSQDLAPAYAINGALYLASPDDLRRTGSFHGDGALPLVIDNPMEALDIDTEWDWMVAQAALAAFPRPEPGVGRE